MYILHDSYPVQCLILIGNPPTGNYPEIVCLIGSELLDDLTMSIPIRTRHVFEFTVEVCVWLCNTINITNYEILYKVDHCI